MMIRAETIRLKQGERFYFEKQGDIGIVKDGTAEIYASTSDRKERMFLLIRPAETYFFSALDEFQAVELYIFAKTDVTLLLYPAFESENLLAVNGDGLKDGMREWFKSLLTLPWLRFFAVRKDDFVGQWNCNDFLTELPARELWLTFLEHQSIFALLISGQFHSLQKYFDDRLKQRQEKKSKLLGAVVGILTDNEDLRLLADTDISKNNGNLIYIVRRIADFFKMDSSLITLPEDILKQLHGLSLLKRLIGKGGMQIRKVTLSGTWYSKDSGVFIARRQEQWVCVIPRNPGEYYIYSEKQPQGELVTGDNVKELSKIAYACYAGFPARKLQVRDLLLFMYGQCWKLDYKYIFLASVIAGFIPLFIPVITKTIFSDIIPIGDRQGLATITQVMMVAGFTSAAVALVRSIAVLRITSHLDMAAEAALWSRLLSMPAGFFKKYQAGDLAQRMTGINAIKSLITGEFIGSIFNTVFSFWSIILMCYYSLRLTGVALLVWLIYFLITAVIYRRVYGFQKNAVAAANKTSGQVLQIFNGLAKFRSQGAEEQAFYLWAKCFGEEWKWNLKLRWQNNYSAIINAVQPLILTLLLYYTAIYGLGEGNTADKVKMTYPEFLGFQAAFSAFNTTLVSMIPLAVKFFSIKPHIENLRPLLEAEPETSVDRLEAGKLSGEIDIRHVSFSYSDDGPEILKDINLQVLPGESIAIVGRSGCGKSTLMRLLLGFEKPKSGAIYYDDIDLRELSMASVRSQMGVVLQNGHLMAGDIFTNIVGTTALTMKDAWLAAERVGLAEDIRRMPMQMYTAISEGSGNISGGQRQRILIARSIVNNPQILLLDEATSALDNTTQTIVTRSLEAMHCTRIVVAHRLSTIRNADRILVMDAGRVVEDGSYDDLMAKNGIFTQLAQRQLV